jgi:hypothetical protein
MRKIISSFCVVGFGLLFVHAGFGCSSSNGADVPDESCEFAQNDDNCWRQLTRSVDDCIADEPEGDAAAWIPSSPTVKGALSADATTCSYTTGRTVTFAKDPRVAGSTSSEGTTTLPDRDFTVTMNGKTCLHYVSSNNGENLSVTGPLGTFTQDKSGTTCPDGSKFKVDPLVLFQKCAGAVVSFGPPPNLPGLYGASGYNATTGEVELHLLGMGKEAYDCTPGGA